MLWFNVGLFMIDVSFAMCSSEYQW